MSRILARFSILLTLLVLGAGASLEAKASPEVWIDVRSPAEYAASSIAGHPNIPHREIANKITALVSDKNAPIYVYCVSGRRAGVAKTTLEGMGYTNVTNAGGIDAVRK